MGSHKLRILLFPKEEKCAWGDECLSSRSYIGTKRVDLNFIPRREIWNNNHVDTEGIAIKRDEEKTETRQLFT